MLAEERRLGRPLSVDALIALALLRQLRRLDTVRLAKEIQRDEDAARRVLATLVEAGLVQAHGATRGRTYTLSAQLYKGLGDTAGYVRQAGFEPIQQAQMVLHNMLRRMGESRGEKRYICAASARTKPAVCCANSYLTTS